MSSLIRLYPACYNGDIQAINAGSPDVQINLQYNHAHQTQIYFFKELITRFTSISSRTLFAEVF